MQTCFCFNANRFWISSCMACWCRLPSTSGYLLFTCMRKKACRCRRSWRSAVEIYIFFYILAIGPAQSYAIKSDESIASSTWTNKVWTPHKTYCEEDICLKMKLSSRALCGFEMAIRNECSGVAWGIIQISWYFSELKETAATQSRPPWKSSILAVLCLIFNNQSQYLMFTQG